MDSIPDYVWLIAIFRTWVHHRFFVVCRFVTNMTIITRLPDLSMSLDQSFMIIITSLFQRTVPKQLPLRHSDVRKGSTLTSSCSTFSLTYTPVKIQLLEYGMIQQQNCLCRERCIQLNRWILYKDESIRFRFELIETLNFKNDNLGQKPCHNSYGIVSTDLDGFPKVNVLILTHNSNDNNNLTRDIVLHMLST